MTKADFLKEAMAKYKKAVKKVTSGADWLSEMNFIYSPQLILRVWFDHTANNHKGEFMHRWCTVEDLGDETIFNKMDEFLCEENTDFPLILLALKKALKKDKAKMIDHLEYKKGVAITPTETFEYTFTVEAFCEAVGIEDNINKILETVDNIPQFLFLNNLTYKINKNKNNHHAKENNHQKNQSHHTRVW